MRKRHLTPSQTADILQVSTSTLRTWCKAFEGHLSESARSDGKRHRTFSSDDLATLTKARDLLHDGKSPVEVDSLLGLADSAPGPAVVLLPEMAGVIQQTQGRLMELESEVLRLRGEVQQLSERHSRQHSRQGQEIDNLRAQVQALLVATTAKRSLWARLRRK